MWIEIDKKILREDYKGNIQQAIQAGDFWDWTSDRIKRTFAFGNGTKSDFKEYMNNNKCYSVFMEI